MRKKGVEGFVSKEQKFHLNDTFECQHVAATRRKAVLLLLFLLLLCLLLLLLCWCWCWYWCWCWCWLLGRGLLQGTWCHSLPQWQRQNPAQRHLSSQTLLDTDRDRQRKTKGERQTDTLTHSFSQTHTQTHTDTHTLTLSLFLSDTHPHTYTRSLLPSAALRLTHRAAACTRPRCRHARARGRRTSRTCPPCGGTRAVPC